MWKNHLRNVHFSVSYLVIFVGTERTTWNVVRIVAGRISRGELHAVHDNLRGHFAENFYAHKRFKIGMCSKRKQQIVELTRGLRSSMVHRDGDCWECVINDCLVDFI